MHSSTSKKEHWGPRHLKIYLVSEAAVRYLSSREAHHHIPREADHGRADRAPCRSERADRGDRGRACLAFRESENAHTLHSLSTVSVDAGLQLEAPLMVSSGLPVAVRCLPIPSRPTNGLQRPSARQAPSRRLRVRLHDLLQGRL